MTAGFSVIAIVTAMLAGRALGAMPAPVGNAPIRNLLGADFARGVAGALPAWSCVLPTARGKSGPGLRTLQPSDAAVFVLPDGEALSKGRITFWVRPAWGPGDARPADMVKVSQGGKPRSPHHPDRPGRIR